ncbi:hypothetical protein GGQ87_002777 [Brevundimonas alba]|uniref:Calcineurin-like phosphoesterase domain-containing protein n=1 Tax=Brevundimonas alba TaxID=74314 RepID=A0A7X5YMQ5_9CAUL|nr:metallophosphoesterase [Brevundimonas alba]NJC42482.1 hypothetical protein [Brevundimonas alba]
MDRRRLVRLAALALAAVVACIALALAWGLHTAWSAPVQRDATVALPDWPTDAARLRVALISDIHIGGTSMSAGRLRRIVNQVNAADPDLILLAGDFVNGHGGGLPQAATDLTAPLSGARARYGVFAVLGNHDYWTDPAGVRAALERAGIVVLDNRAVQAGPVALVGVSDAFSDHDRLDLALRSAAGLTGPRVVLTHSPDMVHDLPPEARLLLAGHTHCGQVVLPLVGSLAERSPREGMRHIYDPHYRCGVIRTPERTVVVTAGIGAGSVPVRIGARPDWWLVTLGPVVP